MLINQFVEHQPCRFLQNVGLINSFMFNKTHVKGSSCDCNPQGQPKGRNIGINRLTSQILQIDGVTKRIIANNSRIQQKPGGTFFYQRSDTDPSPGKGWNLRLEGSARGADICIWFHHPTIINLSTLSSVNALQKTLPLRKKEERHNNGDDGGTGYISIRFAKLLHFTWHGFCIEAKLTLRGSSFSPKRQSGDIICVCIISMKI